MTIPVGAVTVAAGGGLGLPLGAAVFVYWPLITGGPGGMFGHIWSITVEVGWYVIAALFIRPLARLVDHRLLATFFTIAAAVTLITSDPVLDLIRPEGILLGAGAGFWTPEPILRLAKCLGLGLSLRPLPHIGLRTYSLYLWHLPIFLLLKHHSALTGSVLVIVQFACAFVLAEASFRLVELPGRRLLSRRRPLKRTPIPEVDEMQNSMARTPS